MQWLEEEDDAAEEATKDKGKPYYQVRSYD
jgi:hypothetical protein